MSPAQIGRLCEEHRADMVRFALSRVGPVDADDVVHDAVVALLTRPPEVANKSYLLGAVHWAALHARDRDRDRLDRGYALNRLEAAAYAVAPVDVERSAQIRADLAGALAALPAGQRASIVSLAFDLKEKHSAREYQEARNGRDRMRRRGVD